MDAIGIKDVIVRKVIFVLFSKLLSGKSFKIFFHFYCVDLIKDVDRRCTEKIVKVFADVETIHYAIIKVDFVDVHLDGLDNCTERIFHFHLAMFNSLNKIYFQL